MEVILCGVYFQGILQYFIGFSSQEKLDEYKKAHENWFTKIEQMRKINIKEVK